MTLRLQKYLLIVGIASIVLSPLVFFSYPKQAKADTPSCAAAYISSLLASLITSAGLTSGAVVADKAALAVNTGATAVTVPASQPGLAAQSAANNTVGAASNINTSMTAAAATGNNFSTCILKPLMIIMAQRILANITNSLVTWIQSGFQGNPGFVTNINDTISLSSNQAIGHFINGTALSFLCQPFSLQVRLALATQFSAQQYSGCTLTQIDQNIQNFGNTTQAWQSWLKISTIPMNNQFGAYVQLSSRLGNQLNTAVQNINNELQRNLGFLDFKTCPDGYVVDAVGGEPGETIPSQQGSLGAYCPHPVSTTPGSVVQSAITNRFGAEYSELAVGDDINQILGALVNEMVSKTLTGAGGLLGGHTQGAPADLTTAATTNGNEGNLSTVNDINQQVSGAVNVTAGTSVSSGNINLAAGATASASSVGVGSNPTNATDGDVNTTFVSSNESTPSYTLDLGTQQSWNEIDIVAPYPTQTTLGQIEVEISNSSTFDPTNASTKIWDKATNTFVSAQSENPNYILNSTTSPTFTISAPATAEFIKITKASKLALDLINTCVSGQTDSAGNCADPLQISEVEVMTNSANSSGQTTGATGVGETTAPSISFTGNPATGTMTLNTSATAPSNYSLSVSSSGAIATPVSATITLSSSSGNLGNNPFDYESLRRVNNGQSANIDLNNNLIGTGILPISNIELPTEIDLSIEAKPGASGTFNFTVDFTDANGVNLGKNTETFTIIP